MSPSLTPIPSTPAALTTLIHNTLTHFCAATPSCNYRSGVFAREITPQVPVTTCLNTLAYSPHTTHAERKIFLKTLTLLVCLPQRGTPDPVFSPRDTERHASIIAELTELFERDQWNRGVLPADAIADMETKAAKTHGDVQGEAIVATVLLQLTHDALVQACASPKGYHAGAFRHTVRHNTPLLAALGALSTDPRVAPEDAEVFAAAKARAAALLEVQRVGKGRGRVEQGGLYEEYTRWFKGVLGVFEGDCGRRGVRAPEWGWYGGGE